MSKSTEELVADLVALNIELLAELQAKRPAVAAMRETCLAYIESLERNPDMIFSWLPNAGCVPLSRSIASECTAAVVAVLKKRVAKCDFVLK